MFTFHTFRFSVYTIDLALVDPVNLNVLLFQSIQWIMTKSKNYPVTRGSTYMVTNNTNSISITTFD